MFGCVAMHGRCCFQGKEVSVSMAKPSREPGGPRRGTPAVTLRAVLPSSGHRPCLQAALPQPAPLPGALGDKDTENSCKLH